MSKVQEETTFWSGMASTSLYKRSQGRLTRQLTALGLGILLVLGCRSLSRTVLEGLPAWVSTGIPVAIGAVGLWMIYRLVNYPPFANFLIAVEAEVEKVTWPTFAYLKRATIVVVVVMVMFGVVLSLMDVFWLFFFRMIGFLQVF